MDSFPSDCFIASIVLHGFIFVLALASLVDCIRRVIPALVIKFRVLLTTWILLEILSIIALDNFDVLVNGVLRFLQNAVSRPMILYIFENFLAVFIAFGKAGPLKHSSGLPMLINTWIVARVVLATAFLTMGVIFIFLPWNRVMFAREVFTCFGYVFTLFPAALLTLRIGFYLRRHRKQVHSTTDDLELKAAAVIRRDTGLKMSQWQFILFGAVLSIVAILLTVNDVLSAIELAADLDATWVPEECDAVSPIYSLFVPSFIGLVMSRSPGAPKRMYRHSASHTNKEHTNLNSSGSKLLSSPGLGFEGGKAFNAGLSGGGRSSRSNSAPVIHRSNSSHCLCHSLPNSNCTSSLCSSIKPTSMSSLRSHHSSVSKNSVMHRDSTSLFEASFNQFKMTSMASSRRESTSRSRRSSHNGGSIRTELTGVNNAEGTVAGGRPSLKTAHSHASIFADSRPLSISSVRSVSTSARKSLSSVNWSFNTHTSSPSDMSSLPTTPANNKGGIFAERQSVSYSSRKTSILSDMSSLPLTPVNNRGGIFAERKSVSKTSILSDISSLPLTPVNNRGGIFAERKSVSYSSRKMSILSDMSSLPPTPANVKAGIFTERKSVSYSSRKTSILSDVSSLPMTPTNNKAGIFTERQSVSYSNRKTSIPSDASSLPPTPANVKGGNFAAERKSLSCSNRSINTPTSSGTSNLATTPENRMGYLSSEDGQSDFSSKSPGGRLSSTSYNWSPQDIVQMPQSLPMTPESRPGSRIIECGPLDFIPSKTSSGRTPFSNSNSAFNSPTSSTVPCLPMTPENRALSLSAKIENEPSPLDLRMSTDDQTSVSNSDRNPRDNTHARSVPVTPEVWTGSLDVEDAGDRISFPYCNRKLQDNTQPRSLPMTPVNQTLPASAKSAKPELRRTNTDGRMSRSYFNRKITRSPTNKRAVDNSEDSQ